VGGHCFSRRKRTAGIACLQGHLEIVKALIGADGKGSELLLKTQPDGCSCLHAACHQGHTGVVKALIEAGGKPLLLMTRRDGCSCLDIACQHGHLGVVKALAKAEGGALLSRADRDGCSTSQNCLYIACQQTPPLWHHPPLPLEVARLARRLPPRGQPCNWRRARTRMRRPATLACGPEHGPVMNPSRYLTAAAAAKFSRHRRPQRWRRAVGNWAMSESLAGGMPVRALGGAAGPAHRLGGP
jgi:hypothetical protein